MTQEEIKYRKEMMELEIKGLTAQLKELRNICAHPNTFEGNYSWRIGAFDKAIICSDCGELINYAHKYILANENP